MAVNTVSFCTRSMASLARAPLFARPRKKLSALEELQATAKIKDTRLRASSVGWKDKMQDAVFPVGEPDPATPEAQKHELKLQFNEDRSLPGPHGGRTRNAG